MRFESRYRAGLPWSFFGLAALMALAVAVAGSVAAAPATPAIQVEDAWIRWLPANLPAAGYATLTNIGDKPEVLISASSPAYGEVSLHQSRNQGGNVEMVPVQRIAVAAHSSLNFAVAGYHMMLMQPAKPLKPGDRVPIVLRFADGSSLTVDFEVRKPDSSAARHAAQGLAVLGFTLDTAEDLPKVRQVTPLLDSNGSSGKAATA